MTERTAALTDGEWHRLHPATPLLRGGIVVVAVLGVVISNLRGRIVEMFVGAPDYKGDPIDTIYTRGLTGWVLLAFAGVLIVCVALFWLSWRMHTFRIGRDAVEVRSGILFRTHRNARLDRIQGINVTRPLFARLFGAAKLEVSVAGQDANVQLAYLRSVLADALRRDILRLASGARAVEQGQVGQGQADQGQADQGQADQGQVGQGQARQGRADPVHDGADTGRLSPQDPIDRALPERLRRHAASHGQVHDGEWPDAVDRDSATVRRDGVVSRRMNELLAPELDPDAAPPESIVRIPPHRIIGSLVLSGFTIAVLLITAAVLVGLLTRHLWPLFVAIPGILAVGSYYLSRFTRSLRYSIAATADGIRVGFGLFSTTNETLPPGRVHAIEVAQPLLWRPAGWWQVRVNTAGHSQQQRGAAGQSSATILPVGNEDNAIAVLGLMLPDLAGDERRALLRTGMVSRGDEVFVSSPQRARWIRPFSWRRTGYAIDAGVVLLRRGFIWRRLVLVPLARLQSVGIEQGPVYRRLDLARAHLHTVDGPVHARLPAADRAAVLRLFDEVAALAIECAARDVSHHWGRQLDTSEEQRETKLDASYLPDAIATRAPDGEVAP